ncbi:GAF domain-containing protein [Gordonia alkanivorans]|uniref:GAF domain-containing protein n=1 Tax=Gordonia alkanivorans TaxID=84096 RepID=UPI0004B3E885|nr:GAF domain-containing protein [Gordonia alkanivorans]
MGWQLVERLDPNSAPSLIWKDGGPREWASLNQIVRRDGVSAAVLTRATEAAFALAPRSFAEREESPLMDSTVPTKSGSKRLILHHVVGPDDSVVGLLMWIGPADEPAEPRPRSAGMKWEIDSQRTHNSLDTYMLRTNSPKNFASIKDADQFFNRVVRFPDMAHVVDLCSQSDSADIPPLFSKVTMLHDEPRLVNLQIVAKRLGSVVVGIGLDITQWEPAQMDPLTAMRASGLSPASYSRAVMAFQERRGIPGIVHWITDPPSWLAYWDADRPLRRAPGGLICPDDWDVLAEAKAQIDSGAAETVTVTVRLQGADGSWIGTSATLSDHPGTHRMLYLIDIAAEDSST